MFCPKCIGIQEVIKVLEEEDYQSLGYVIYNV